jgi:hypothetical protein
MTNHDLAAILSTIVGVCSLAADAAFGQYLSTILGTHSNVVLAALGAIGLIAATVLRVIANPSPPTGQVSVTAPKETP